jgi:hypothetical protein
MKKLLVLLVSILFSISFAIGQNSKEVFAEGLNKAPRNESLKGSKSAEIHAFSYRLGSQDLCTIAPRSEGEIFRIQFTAMDGFNHDIRQFVAEKAYGEIYPEYILNQNITRYLIGDFDDYDSAIQKLIKVKDLGYRHAFVVSYIDGIRHDL